MENAFYQELFSHFMAVAWKEAPEVARNEDVCREIFHDRVLFPLRITSMEEAEARIKGEGRKFPTARSYKNFLYTMFKNAIIDHLRERSRAGRKTETMDGDRDLQLSDSQDHYDEETIMDLARGIFFVLTREQRRLLALRYQESKTLVEVGVDLGVSKSTVERWERAIMARIFPLLDSKKEDCDEEDFLRILARILDEFSSEDAEQ